MVVIERVCGESVQSRGDAYLRGVGPELWHNNFQYHLHVDHFLNSPIQNTNVFCHFPLGTEYLGRGWVTDQSIIMLTFDHIRPFPSWVSAFKVICTFMPVGDSSKSGMPDVHVPTLAGDRYCAVPTILPPTSVARYPYGSMAGLPGYLYSPPGFVAASDGWDLTLDEHPRHG